MSQNDPQQQTRTVPVSVIEDSGTEFGTFGVADVHRPDLPKPLCEPLDAYAVQHVAAGEPTGEGVATLEYVPNGDVVEIRPASADVDE